MDRCSRELHTSLSLYTPILEPSYEAPSLGCRQVASRRTTLVYSVTKWDVMPSNTGLYNDSDDDSLSNELGPSDGYFNQRAPHPQQVLVPDPSLEAEGDKAREAQQEEEAQRQSEASPPRRRDSQYVQSPPPRRTFNSAYEGDQTSEQTPLLPTAPPAYSDATAGTSYRPPASSNPVESGNRRPSGGYDTIRPSEAFPHHSEPQHLRDSQAQSQDSPNKHERMQRSRRYVRRCCGATAKFVLVAVAIAIGVGFIVNAITSIHGVTVGPLCMRDSSAHADTTRSANPLRISPRETIGTR